MLMDVHEQAAEERRYVSPQPGMNASRVRALGDATRTPALANYDYLWFIACLAPLDCLRLRQ